MTSSLVFLCGALRSGTSMTHLMLNAHSQISNPGEFDFFFDLLAKKGREPTVNEFFEYLSSDRIFLSKNLRLNPSHETYAEVLEDFVDQLSENGRRLCLNIHRNFDLAHRYFPASKFVHIIRDPRDVARSSIGMGWAGNVYYGVDHWVNTEQSWLRVMTNLSESQYVQIQFEELVHTPEQSLAEACVLLGVEYESSMLEYDENSRYAKPDRKLTNQWKQKLTDRDIEIVESKASELMTLHGYPLANKVPRPAARLEKIRFKIRDVLYREKFWIKRYGFWLYVGRRLTAKLGLRQLRKPLLAKSRMITEKHLK